MEEKQRINILLVDDQPGKLASYEVILSELDENLIKASSAKEALEILLKTDVAVILVDVCMPELDGFELAQMIREHPRFKDTAIIFISAVLLSELDSLKAYEMGGVDYVAVPVVPGVLRAKVRVFVELHRKSRELARMNEELERRVKERTAELEAATARQELLAREVDHRARNALAVIQAIVSMMPASSGGATASIIEGRIRAMARAHTLLSNARWEGADLSQLVNEELEPFRAGDRVQVHGAAVAIKPSVAQNFALAIHELATNAAKYGALSSPNGKLEVSWSLSKDGLVLDWLERDGPRIAPPRKMGFGTKVIEASIRKQLGGEFRKDWPPTGLKCQVWVPAENFASPGDRGPATSPIFAEELPAPKKATIRGRRILLVEDEPLVALMMSHMIGDLGGVVVGPFGALTETANIALEDIDAAVLDVNVAGELVYPLADRLARTGTPIVFLTGYDAKSVDSRYEGSSILTKPIDEHDLAAVLTGLFESRAAPASIPMGGKSLQTLM